MHILIRRYYAFMFCYILRTTNATVAYQYAEEILYFLEENIQYLGTFLITRCFKYLDDMLQRHAIKSNITAAPRRSLELARSYFTCRIFGMNIYFMLMFHKSKNRKRLAKDKFYSAEKESNFQILFLLIPLTYYLGNLPEFRGIYFEKSISDFLEKKMDPRISHES